MYRIERALYEEDLYVLTQEEYDQLPDGTVLFDATNLDTFVKGSSSNYSTPRTVSRRGALGLDILSIGWTQGMAESQGLDKEFMFMLFKS